MTATNHAITGALIAAVVKQPELAIPLAFLAHFAMDSLPHFGISYKDELTRNKDPLFLKVLIWDVLIAGFLLVLLPVLLAGIVPVWVCVLSMFACMSPDLVWGWHFYRELKYKKQTKKGWFSNFHKKIQGSEKPSGAYVELFWMAAVFSLLMLKI